MVKIRFLLTVPLALLLLTTSCSEANEQTLAPKPGAAVPGNTPVGFSAYARRGLTRAGYAGVLDLTQLEQAEADGGGFGVFAYYTDLKRYDQTYIPNFMYNQGVFKNGAGANWEYTPMMYWPNESGIDAQSDDEDKVSFFAYAPYVRHSSAASGSVADATHGITGFSRNTAVGDPIVKYIASFDPAQSVDLCWGVCASTTWAKYLGTTNQTMVSGLPWTDVEHPQGIDQKMTFTFRHALSQLNVQIDADPDIAAHDETTEVATGTKVYVRSISFTGIATHGALNLNNTVADEPLWLDYSGSTDLPYGQSVTVHDGRRDGREGANGAEANNELPAGLNPQIVQNATPTTGVTHELQNLFNGADATTPVYVIPTGEKMTVSIVYDVETINPALSGYTSDGVNHGVSVENKITKDITWSSGTGLEAGKNYTLKLHLGLNSVKFDADVADWNDSPVNGNGWLPHNIATDPPVSLSLGASITMPMTTGVGSPQTLTATTKPAGTPVTWSNTDDGVATIAPAPASSRAGSRAAQLNVGPCNRIVITPVAAGTTIVTAHTTFGDAQCVVTVTDETTQNVSVTQAETDAWMYATQTKTLTATTDPTGRPLTWTSTNTAAATVDASGVVTGVNAGLTYITATTESGQSALCELTVLPTELTLNKTATTIYVNDNETLTATSVPTGIAVAQWTSDMTSVATVSSSGVVNAIAVGTAHITATIPGGGTATCTITVTGSVATVTSAPAAISPLTYSGSAQALVSAGTAANGTMKYATGTSSAPTSGWSTSVPTGTAAGDYYVWYKAEGTGGYLDSTPVKVDVNIAKKAAAISFADAGPIAKTTSDGAFTNALTNTGDGSVTYSIENSGSNANINTSTGQITSLGSAAGTATVTATVVPDANHSYASTSVSYTITITVNQNPSADPSVGNWSSDGEVDMTGNRLGL